VTCTFGNIVLVVDSCDVISFAAFILLVILRYFRQDITEHVEADGMAEKEQNQALVVVAEPEEEEPRHALVVAERKRQC